MHRSWSGKTRKVLFDVQLATYTRLLSKLSENLYDMIDILRTAYIFDKYNARTFDTHLYKYIRRNSKR